MRRCREHHLQGALLEDSLWKFRGNRLSQFVGMGQNKGKARAVLSFPVREIRLFSAK